MPRLAHLLTLLTLLLAPRALQAQTETTHVRREVVETAVHDPRYQALAAAQAKHKAGDLPGAIAATQAVVADHPDFALAHRLLGHLLLAAGQDTAARQAYATALGLGMATPDLLRALITIDQSHGRHHSAQTAIRLALLQQPDDPSLLAADASASADAGDLSAAIHTMQRTVDLHPDSSTWRFNLGVYQKTAGQTAEAIVTFETVWLLGHRDPRLPLQIAQLHLQQRQYRRALAWLQHSTHSHHAATTNLLRAQAHLALGDTTAASHHATAALTPPTATPATAAGTPPAVATDSASPPTATAATPSAATTTPAADSATTTTPAADSAANTIPTAATDTAPAGTPPAIATAAISILIHCGQDYPAIARLCADHYIDLTHDQRLALANRAYRAHDYAGTVASLSPIVADPSLPPSALHMLADAALHSQQPAIATQAVTQLIARHGLTPATQALLHRLSSTADG